MNHPTADEARTLLNRRATTRPQNAAPTPKIEGATATIRLFDPIDSWGEWWGMSAKELATVVDDLPSNISEIRLLINSPGGDAFEGLAIVNVLRAHSARIVAVVQGLAASAASYVAAAADETVMAPNSTLMIHEAWGVCIGSADDMLSMGATLDQLSGNIADIYAAKSGDDVATWRERMKAETWYTAAEAVEVGLADRTEETVDAGEVSNSITIKNPPGTPATTPVADATEPKIADPTVDERASHDRDTLVLLSI